MARLADVAKEAGVSITLVSRVLNDDPAARATSETRQRIVAAAALLNYRPHYAARALRSSRTNTISLAIPDLTNAIFTELARGVEVTAQTLGYTVLLGRSESVSTTSTLRTLFEEGRIDGLLLQGRDDATATSLTEMIGRFPVVLINARASGHRGSVMVDDRAAAALATQHLIDLGHRRIGLINGLKSSITARRRGQGYADALHDAGLRRAAGSVTHLGYHAQTAGPALDQVMNQSMAPTAVVVANVNAAFGVLGRARQLGLRLPSDLSVIAIHDAWTAEFTGPPLTTVRLPLYELGSEAVRSLHDRLSGSAGRDVVVTHPECKLILRESTGPPR